MSGLRTPETPAPMLACEGVSVAYGSELVLRDVSLTVARGTLLPLVGPNGAGKTTLLKAILGLVPLRAGRVRWPGSHRRPAYVPQTRTIDPIYPVCLRRIVEMGLHAELGPWRRPGPNARARVDGVLESLGLAGHQHKVFGELSGGMKQKALLARALVAAADVLLLDEPTSELDERTEEAVLAMLRHLAAQEGRTILFVHHGLHQAARLAPTLCWVEHGAARLVAADDVLRQPPAGAVAT